MVTKGPEILTSAGVGVGHQLVTPLNRFVVVDLAVLYSDSPQFFTEQGGDDLFTMRASGYHEPTWDRDMVIYVQNDRRTVNSDDNY